MSLIRAGIVGCGNISGIYFRNLAAFCQTTVTACADLDVERAKAVGAEHGIAWAGSTEDLLARDDVDVVVNLTIPAAHHSVAKAALEAGKLAYNEKPFSVQRAQGAELVALAAKSNLLTGCAPDTFLGAGLQTCRKLIDSGAIGEPIGFNAWMLGHGADGWHPNPAFFYEPGAGPLFDMGPYYLTALVFLLGPVERAVGMARASFKERVLRHGVNAGSTIPVKTPTHIVSALEFKSGAIGGMNMSFDVWGADVPCIEIYGSEGTLGVPDPNSFCGPIRIKRPEAKTWEEAPLEFRFDQNSRGLGVLDLAVAHRDHRPPRAGGELAFHVLDVMHTILEAAEQERSLKVESSVARPEPMAATGPADDL
ncbi:MAG: Gfo/Idh/MocA family protein [Fimbriimonadaceae bacterium]